MIPHRSKACAEFPRQFGERRPVFVCGQCLNSKPPVLALEQVNGARTDRASRAQNRDAPRRSIRFSQRLSSNRHPISPNKQATGGSVETPAEHTHHGGGGGGCQKSIEPVHQPPVSGDEV